MTIDAQGRPMKQESKDATASTERLPPAALTLDDLNELAYPLHHAATVGFKVVNIDVEHAKQLLAMARRLVELEGASAAVRDNSIVQSGRYFVDPLDQLLEQARELGWRPEGGESDGRP